MSYQKQNVRQYADIPYAGTGKPATSETSEETDARIEVLQRYRHDAIGGMPEDLSLHVSFRSSDYSDNVVEWHAAQLALFMELMQLPDGHDLVTLFRAMQRNRHVVRGDGKKQPANLSLMMATGTVVQIPSYEAPDEIQRTCYERNPSMEGLTRYVLEDLSAKIRKVDTDLNWMRYVEYSCSGCASTWSGEDLVVGRVTTTEGCPKCENPDTVTKTDRTDKGVAEKGLLVAQHKRLLKAFTKSTKEHSKCLEHAVWARSQPLYKRDDNQVPLLEINLRDEHKDALRPYQHECVEAIQGKNGHVIIPCGGGKSLTMIDAIRKKSRSTLLFVPNAEAAEQMRDQILKWTSIHPNHVVLFTSNRKPPNWFLRCVQRAQFYPMIFITTYGMASIHDGDEEDDSVMQRAAKRARTATGYVATSGSSNRLFRDVISKARFGLVMLDEAHTAATENREDGITRFVHGYDLPADDPARPQFIGFTATRERLDGGMKERVMDLLGGPLLYEVSLNDLQKQGHIATVYIKAVTFDGRGGDKYSGEVDEDQFAEDYQTAWLRNQRRLNIMHNIIQTHYERNKNSRIIVVIERRAVLDAVTSHPYYKNATVVTGDVRPKRRHKIYRHFRNTPGSLLFVSKVGEVAVDLPDANVLILLACTDRASKIQYIGRVQRKKKENVAHAHMLCDVTNDRERFFMAEQLTAARIEGYDIKTERVVREDWMTGSF